MSNERRGDGPKEPEAPEVGATEDASAEPRASDHPDAGLETVRASKYPGTPPAVTATSTAVMSPEETQTGHTLAIGRRAIRSLAPPPPEAPLMLSRLRYDDVTLLGVGGEGRVYSALDRNFRREVAIKVMRAATSDDARRRDAFIREARVTASLEHPNILPIYDIDSTDDGRMYFTMRKAQGRTLSSLIKQAAASPDDVPEEISTWDKKIRILDKVCDALAYAHSKGYVHQDVKPSNIILGGFGGVTLVDWGTALDREARQRPGLQVIGTPTYMSPEQARVDLIDERSDIYCLGGTLFHLLTLRAPVTDPDPVSVWEKKCKGHIDDVERPRDVPEDLFRIALKAMAFDPGDRFQSVTELQAALRDVQRHDQSIKLTESVEQVLAQPDRVKDYDQVTALSARVQSALELWPENEHAARLVEQVRKRHAEIAIDTGDLALAERLVMLPIADRDTLEKRLVEARELRRRQRQRSRWTALAAGAAVLLLVSLAVFLVRDYYQQRANWHDLASYDFSQRAAYSRVARSREQFTVTEPLSPDQYTPEGLLLKNAEIYWFKDAYDRGDFRLELRVKWTKKVDGLEIFANAERAQPPLFWEAPSGLLCQFGGWQGRLTFFTVLEKAGLADSTGGVGYTFLPGRWYDLVLERKEGHVLLYVNGKVVLEDFVFVPFEGKDNRWFALRAWNQPVILSKARIRRLSIPEKASPVVAGDSLFRIGTYSDALTQYEILADDYPGTVVREVALAKAYLAAKRLGQRAKRLELLDLLAHEYPRSYYLTRCLEEEAVGSWLEERYDDALKRVGQVFARNPETRVALKVLALSGYDGRSRWPTSASSGLAKWVGRTSHLQRLDLSGLHLKSLDFLGSNEIDDLNLGQNEIRDLGPLRRVKLRSLEIFLNPVSDLSPLRGKQLESLDISDTNVTDLSPLAGIPIQYLVATRTHISDWSVLKTLALDNLNVSATGLRDLEPFRGLRLKTFWFERNDVSSLEPLRGMPLEDLRFERNQVRDLEPIRNAPLGNLRAFGNSIESMDALAGMKNLTFVDLGGGGRIRDVRALAGHRFETLLLNGNQIEDVSALASTKSGVIDLAHNRITDASPLAKSGSDVINLYGNPLRNLGDLAEHPPKALWFSSTQFEPRLLDALSKEWRSSASTSDLAYIVDVQRAYQAGDRARLIDLRRKVGDRWYLPIFEEQTLSAARSTAEGLGAHLVACRDRAQAEQLSKALPMFWSGVWLDYRITPDELRAPGGGGIKRGEVFVEYDVWLAEGAEGVGYREWPGFGAVISRWPAGTPPEKQLFAPILEWPPEPR